MIYLYTDLNQSYANGEFEQRYYSLSLV